MQFSSIFKQIFLLFLFNIYGVLLAATSHHREHLGMSRILAECRPTKSDANGGAFLCDPRGVLSTKQRRTLRQRLNRFREETANIGSTRENDFCRKKGITVGIILTHWAITKSDENDDGISADFVNKLALDVECQKFVLLLVPTLELDKIKIFHGSGLPFKDEQLDFLVEFEKPLLREKHYLEAFSSILEEIRLLQRETQPAQHQPIHRVDIKERRQRHGHRSMESGEIEESDSREEFELEILRKMEKRQQAMTQSFLALIATCAVLFSLVISITAFIIFYYVSIVRGGGLSCWGDSEKNGSPAGVYFVKEVSLEETTVGEELVGMP